MATRLSFILFLGLASAACNPKEDREHSHAHHHSSDYVIKLSDLEKFNAGDGEQLFQMEGKKFGFEKLSFAITETQPGGGPAVHYHDTEEAHVVMNDKVTYLIGDSIFTVEGPFVTNVPAGVNHTFINAGDSILNLIAVFPQNSFGQYHEVRENPLLN